ncbi:MAG: [FeFe] hydrogenase H-cluster maturation GTPase HydF [Eubacterium sp.]|nr:[FeFe] hydrogenase H-cluster maturation GTPase HydF [Eubacterium sp.]
MADLNKTPSGMRTSIGFFGKTNSGKSSVINALVGQDVSIVSEKPGTTTDPVYKAMEIAPIGPCLLIDTAGLEDETALGEKRISKTKNVAAACDVAVVIFYGENFDTEKRIVTFFKEKNVPVIAVAGHADTWKSDEVLPDVLRVSPVTGEGMDELLEEIKRAAKNLPEPTILGKLVGEGDLVLLVMPQDKQAPKGRLILPQVTTLRELLDKHARTMCVAPEELETALSELKNPPKLIITDSQVFDFVYERKPEASMLTSFSVLYAALKGDVDIFIAGAKSIENLRPGAKVLVAESCSHAPLEEDIGREKIPNLLRKKVGGEISVDIVAGKDFPEDLNGYDLILQCGGCMVNRRQIMSRVEAAIAQGVPITNYGIAIAYLKGILDKIRTS